MIELFCIGALCALAGMTLTLQFIPYEYDTELMREDNDEENANGEIDYHE